VLIELEFPEKREKGEQRRRSFGLEETLLIPAMPMSNDSGPGFALERQMMNLGLLEFLTLVVDSLHKTIFRRIVSAVSKKLPPASTSSPAYYCL
jgi:hypothetical protein